IGIGINSDNVITGNIGSKKRMEFTAIGDGVNLAARLESATKHYGCDIIISENTYQLWSEQIQVRELDYICLKGKNQPVRIYELQGLKEEALPGSVQDLWGHYHHGRQQFEAGNFTNAIAAFQQSLRINPCDRPTQIQLKRCLKLQHHPPVKSWDGVWVLKEK
ncbi:MAG: adenylate/guanylate cyclase domain-containing protein, partial [Cyanobacteria bacterium P01_H01_bin.121]